jgi:ATP synthase protein I
MIDEPSSERRWELFSRTVGAKERRRLRARRNRTRDVWFGLGMFGVIGWSVALPTVLVTALGVWIDGRYPSRFSWTLMLLTVGVGLGCLNAWHWIKEEQRTIDRESRSNGPDIPPSGPHTTG